MPFPHRLQQPTNIYGFTVQFLQTAAAHLSRASSSRILSRASSGTFRASQASSIRGRGSHGRSTDEMDLGDAWKVLAERRGAVIQPPRPPISAADAILERAAGRAAEA